MRCALLVLLLLAMAVPAWAASCPSTCLLFDKDDDAAKFIELLTKDPGKGSTDFVRDKVGHNAARLMPAGTQFVLLAEHKSGSSSYYAVHLPGGLTTLYLVAIP